MSTTSAAAELLQLFPASWASDNARTSGSLYGVMRALGVALGIMEDEAAYAKLQARLLTATDSNLEAIANDFLGPGNGRFSLLVGNNLVPETDPQYRAHIQTDITAPANTIAAIQAKVTRYINTQYIASYTQNQLLLGADSVGALDQRGGLDGRPKSTPPIPQVYVFDTQSDPRMAAKVGLVAANAQFCVMLIYGGLQHDGFFLGRTHIGRASHILTPKIRVITPLSDLDAVVQKVKAVGTIPVYADNLL